MTTLTLTSTPNAPIALRPGDRLVGVDGTRIAGQAVVIDGTRVRADWRDEPVALYLDTHEYVIEREHAPHLAAALAPAPQPAPKKARKPATRTIDGLRLISEGGGAWRTEDGRYEVRLNYGGVTYCDGPHPVRVTWKMAGWARKNATHAHAKPILWAIALGKSGYYCQGEEEHQAPDSWIVWDAQRGDYAGGFGMHAESFTEAAHNLARHLRAQEGRAGG